VVDALGRVHGATLLLQDASSRVSLEERVQRLHEKVRQDGLTGVANRAEFDRVHPECVELHLAQGTPYSMILCDLDHFKKVNDTYGHQAGDDALLTFTSLLSRACRGSDVIARYGGEEFVVLCPDCHSASAAVRAEAVREALAAERQPMLDGKCITASFGVTELQATDTPETMLRRADRALLQAKNDGRNVVVQLTAAIDNASARRPRSRWFGWLQRKPGQLLLSRKVITAVPVKLALEKLRGFVADHKAHIAEIAGNRVTLQSRISAEPRLALLIEMEFREVHWDAVGATETGAQHTVVHVTIRPQRQRDRRRGDADRLARHLLADLKSYLMAQDYDRLGK
jgi:diguanylate cyclase (GGDEF)-like protein